MWSVMKYFLLILQADFKSEYVRLESCEEASSSKISDATNERTSVVVSNDSSASKANRKSRCPRKRSTTSPAVPLKRTRSSCKRQSLADAGGEVKPDTASLFGIPDFVESLNPSIVVKEYSKVIKQNVKPRKLDTELSQSTKPRKARKMKSPVYLRLSSYELNGFVDKADNAFSTRGLLKRTSSSKHYACTMCKASFHLFSTLSQHTRCKHRRHLSPRQLKYQLLTAKAELLMRRRQLTKTIEGRKICELCNWSTKLASKMQHHFSVHHFQRKCSFREHLKVREQVICSGAFSSGVLLRHHRLTKLHMPKHSATRLACPDHCSRVFRSMNLYKRHFKLFRASQKNDADSRPRFPCPKCSATFVAMPRLRAHVAQFHGSVIAMHISK